MKTNQEPKYIIQGPIVNRASHQPIPDDEPVFILRGRDKHAVPLLQQYIDMVADPVHQEAVGLRIQQFERFARENPDRMKYPDTVLTEDWRTL